MSALPFAEWRREDRARAGRKGRDGTAKVLHVTNWPGPPFDGTTVNRHQTLRRMSALERCRFVVVRRTTETAAINSQTMADLGIDNEGVDVVSVSDRFHYLSRLHEFIRSEMPPDVAVVHRRVGGVLQAKVEEVVAEWQPQALMIWNPYWAAALCDTATHLRRVMFACDSISLYSLSVARNASSFLRRVYSYDLARRHAKYEQLYLPRYDHVVFVGLRDSAHVQLPAYVPVSVIGNGVDVTALRPSAVGSPPGARRILFHGNLSYLPNEACVRFLGDEVGPRLEKELGVGGFEVRVLGAGGQRLRSYAASRPWLRLMGYVENLGEELGRAAVYAAPLRMGSGIKNKVLEAMACGLPVVGTREAFEGMDVRSGEHVLECPLRDIADRIIELLRDRDRCRTLGESARGWVVANANWDDVAQRFDEILRGQKQG